jgi:miniconductance mechanosensitive channel
MSGGDVVVNNTPIPAFAVRLAIVLIIAIAAYQIAVRLFIPIIERLSRNSKTRIDDIIFNRHLLRRSAHLIPAAIISTCLPGVLDAEAELYNLLSRAVNLYFVLVGLAVYDALLSAIRDVFEMYDKSKKVSINGLVQALKVIGTLLAFILAVSILAGKSPLYFISGLGAFTAILMLIFKDPIMGLVAGVQLSTMDLVRKGDWIEIPKHGADGDVIDITLTTVRVQNWDKTIVAVPAYELVSSSFKNWRGMSESGGRRIKRALRIKIDTVRFLTEGEIERLRKIKLLSPYFDQKLAEINRFNAEKFAGCDLSITANGRRLTNIGTFRAYCEAYLRGHPGINQGMTLLVRLLEPTELGIPLEIYVFTNDVRWAAYEGVQSDIFEHLLAIVREFGLTVYER